MNSPLSVICQKYKIPFELENIIQSYTVNDVVYTALQEYFHYLYYAQQLYSDFVYDNYIIPNCYCALRRRRKYDCNPCYYFEYTDKYTLSSYLTCLTKNPQCSKILSYSF